MRANPVLVPASTHVNGNAVNRHARKREKGSQPFNEDNRNDFVVAHRATEKQCGEDEFVFGRRPGMYSTSAADSTVLAAGERQSR
jgi:hypothetical protein